MSTNLHGALVLAASLFWFLYSASCQEIIAVASSLSGAVFTSTNAQYKAIGAWQHQLQTGVSTSSNHVNYSGFLSAVSEQSHFRIVAAGFAAETQAVFALTVPTLPGRKYLVQYVDDLD